MFYEIRINVDGLIWWLETSSVNEAFFYGVVKSQFLMQPPNWWLSMHDIYGTESNLLKLCKSSQLYDSMKCQQFISLIKKHQVPSQVTH